MIDGFDFALKIEGDDFFEKFECAFERMTREFTNAVVLAIGAKPVDAIAHRMERA